MYYPFKSWIMLPTIGSRTNTETQKLMPSRRSQTDKSHPLSQTLYWWFRDPTCWWTSQQCKTLIRHLSPHHTAINPSFGEAPHPIRAPSTTSCWSPVDISFSLSALPHCGGHKAIRAITRNCVVCRWHSNPQLMGQLPKERVTPGVVCSNVGLDYAGPEARFNA